MFCFVSAVGFFCTWFLELLWWGCESTEKNDGNGTVWKINRFYKQILLYCYTFVQCAFVRSLEKGNGKKAEKMAEK